DLVNYSGVGACSSVLFFFSSRRRHTRFSRDWSSDVCSSDLFRGDAAFRPWLFAIAVNLARNRLRWWRRRPNVSLDEWAEVPASEIGRASCRERLEIAAEIVALQEAIRSYTDGVCRKHTTLKA